MAESVAAVYADALFAIGKEKGCLVEIQEDARTFLSIWKQQEELLKFFTNPRVGEQEKEAFLHRVFEGNIHEEIFRLMELMLKKSRISFLPETLSQVMDQIDHYEGIGTAYVTTAMEISPDRKEQIRKKLLKDTGLFKLRIYWQVDPSLIGGIKIRIGDRVVDASVQERIRDMSSRLMKLQVNRKAVTGSKEG